MPMLHDPSQKYPRQMPFQYRERTWPDTVISQAPIWMSSCLRDGNQALVTPMTPEKKMEMFHMLADQIGFKEIEVGFPAASDIEFAFIRRLIDERHIPEGVRIAVLTQAKPKMIEETMAAIKGAPGAIFHFYLATSKKFCDLVLRKEESEIIEMAIEGTRHIRDLAKQNPDTPIQLEFSLEHASDTAVQTARNVINAVTNAWGATPNNKVIINAPATVEVGGPHVYADKIEWLSNNVERRDSIVLSVHPHNDRGMGVAAAELALQAGADRVEGTLFGGGERTGNVDLVTLALNMYTHGVSPQLDFSDLPSIIETWQRCTGMSVSPRQPYAGELVFTAFSGSHQDAIAKGLAAYTMPAEKNVHVWNIPYVPADPHDIGRSRDGLIRANSQSGRAAGAAIMREKKGLELPPALTKHFADVIQAEADRAGTEVTPDTVVALFRRHYKSGDGGFHYIGHTVCGTLENTETDTYLFNLTTPSGGTIEVQGQGNGPVSALTNAFGVHEDDTQFHSQNIGQRPGSAAQSATYVQMTLPGHKTPFFGVSTTPKTDQGSTKAALHAINAALRAGAIALPTNFGGMKNG